MEADGTLYLDRSAAKAPIALLVQFSSRIGYRYNNHSQAMKTVSTYAHENVWEDKSRFIKRSRTFFSNFLDSCAAVRMTYIVAHKTKFSNWLTALQAFVEKKLLNRERLLGVHHDNEGEQNTIYVYKYQK